MSPPSRPVASSASSVQMTPVARIRSLPEPPMTRLVPPAPELGSLPMMVSLPDPPSSVELPSEVMWSLPEPA